MQNQNHLGTGAVVEIAAFAAAVANLGIVKSIQLVIEYSARSARGLDREVSMKASLEEMLIPEGWSTSKTFKMKRRTAHSGNIVPWNITMKKWILV